MTPVDKPTMHYSIPEPEVEESSGDEKNTQKGEELLKQAIKSYKAGNSEVAVSLLTDAVSVDDSNHKAWNAFGVILSTAKRYSDADVCFSNALLLDENNETYRKNYEKNLKKIKPETIIEKLKGGKLKLSDLLEKKIYGLPLLPLTAGLVILIILLLLSMAFASPLSETADCIQISAKLNPGENITITNLGDKENSDLSSISWTVDGVEIPPGTGMVLLPEQGSSATVDESIPGINLSDETTVTVTAEYKDKSSEPIAEIQFVPFPIYLENVSVAPVAEYIQKYKAGDVLSDSSSKYWMIKTVQIDGNYNLIRLIQNTVTQFSQVTGDTEVIEQKKVDNTYKYVTHIDTTPVSLTKNPAASRIYQDNQIVTDNTSPDNEITDAMYVLGFDEDADAYRTVLIHKHYNGEWGYRDTAEERYPRAQFEEKYPKSLGRVPRSSITIGSDSLPGGISPYIRGDIISTGTGSNEKYVIILSYNPADYTYTWQDIKSNPGRGWYTIGENMSGKAIEFNQIFKIFINNEDPDLMTHVT